jgi:CRISPR/Cas system-associated exonuclease Cas4 (RecB family)
VDLIIVENAKKETPTKWALCGSNHPANYKGCENYRNLIKGKNTFRNNTQRTQPVNTNIYRNNIQHNANSQQQRSYADVNKSNTNQVEDTAIILTKFLDEFKDCLINCFNKIA